MAINPFEVFSAVAQLAGVVGIFFLYQQIRLSRKAAQCQLINDLEKEFVSYYVIFAKLKPGGDWHESASLSREEIGQLESLMHGCSSTTLIHVPDSGFPSRCGGALRPRRARARADRGGEPLPGPVQLHLGVSLAVPSPLVVAGGADSVAAGDRAPFASRMSLDEVEHAAGRIAGAQPACVLPAE